MIYLINIYKHYSFLFLWNMKLRTIQVDFWLYSYNRSIGYCDIVQILHNTIIIVTTFVRRSITSHYLFWWNIQFRAVEGYCWLQYSTNATGKCDIVQIFLLLLDLNHWIFVLLIILCSQFKILQHNNTEKQYLVNISLYCRSIWGIRRLLFLKFVFSWK